MKWRKDGLFRSDAKTTKCLPATNKINKQSYIHRPYTFHKNYLKMDCSPTSKMQNYKTSRKEQSRKSI